MTWTLNEDTGEVTAPWGETVATLDPPYSIPADVQEAAAVKFRGETFADLTTDRLVDYWLAASGAIEVLSDG